jgi:AmmeMemoRadiSam system protein A
MIDIADQDVLIEIARMAVRATVNRATYSGPISAGVLAKPAAAFVTLHVRGQLRGCVGHLEEDAPLAQTIAHCARLACTVDRRFSPVTASEVDLLDIEISVLGPFERVTAVTEIEIGRHGLLIERDHRRGLLLPQVAAEYRWTAEVFIQHTCRKAGLPPDGWQQGAALWRFDADVFGSR